MQIPQGGRLKAYASVALLLFVAVRLWPFGPQDPAPPQVISVGEGSTPLPYARIADHPPQYEGPGRRPEEDIRSREIKIGLLVPLEGSHAEAGRALQLAAELAIEDANGQEEYRGWAFRLQTRSASGPWGKASSEVVRLIYADQVVALVTSTEGGTAHVAEQVANKAGVPVLSMAPDSTTTEINLPWIFRCVPSDKKQAELLAREIYAERGFTKVAVVSQDHRDGRLGALAFRAAAQNQRGLVTLQLARKPVAGDFDLLLAKLLRERVEALVLWTEAADAARIVRHLRQSKSSIEIYLSVQATQQPFFTLCGKSAGGVHVVAPVESTNPAAGSERFAAKYKARSRTAPTPTATATFDCVRLLKRAVNVVGPNRTRLRDYLATGLSDSDEMAEIAFDPEGNLRGAWMVRTYQVEDECCPRVERQRQQLPTPSW